MWELGTGELKDTLIGHTSHVVGVAFTPDGKKLLSSGWDETIKVRFAGGESRGWDRYGVAGMGWLWSGFWAAQ